jgi:hypothetical protein
MPSDGCTSSAGPILASILFVAGTSADVARGVFLRQVQRLHGLSALVFRAAGALREWGAVDSTGPRMLFGSILAALAALSVLAYTGTIDTAFPGGRVALIPGALTNRQVTFRYQRKPIQLLLFTHQ